jgi:hypothetical protein
MFLNIWYNNLKKHVDYDHATIVNFFEEEVNALVRVPFEKQPIKKRMNVSRSGMSKFIFL